MAVAERVRGQRTRSRNNRERIVEIAVRLLNEHGEAAVGTARIAQELQISPGNLYYHFENREEIVRAVFPRIRDALHDALTPDPGTEGAEQLARHYIGGFRVMYEFRFFFSGLPQLLRADDQLRRDYLELEGVELKRIRSIIKPVLAKLTNPPSSVELEQITTNTWMTFLSWLNFVCLRKRSSEVRFDDVSRGLQHVFGVLAPWLEPPFRNEVRHELDRMFAAEKRRRRLK